MFGFSLYFTWEHVKWGSWSGDCSKSDEHARVHILNRQHVPTFWQIMLIHGTAMRQMSKGPKQMVDQFRPMITVLGFGLWGNPKVPKTNPKVPKTVPWFLSVWLRKTSISAGQILSFQWLFPKPFLGGYQCVSKLVCWVPPQQNHYGFSMFFLYLVHTVGDVGQHFDDRSACLNSLTYVPSSWVRWRWFGASKWSESNVWIWEIWESTPQAHPNPRICWKRNGMFVMWYFQPGSAISRISIGLDVSENCVNSCIVDRKSRWTV